MINYIKNKKKNFIITLILLVLILLSTTLIIITNKKNNIKTETNTDTHFHTFTNKLFKELVISDSLTLHYTLSDPQKFNIPISTNPYTFGNIPLSTNNFYFTENKNRLTKLESFNYKDLDTEQQYTYDTLYWHFNNIESRKKYFLYEEYLNPHSGVQIQLPILLSEYNFHDKTDVANYLKLLPDIERYFEDICKFEKIKYKKGLFMNKHNAQKVLKQCKEMIINISTSLFISEFNNKVENISNISQNEIYDFEKKNEKIVLSNVLNAYTNLYSTLSILNKNNTQKDSLFHLPNGKEYYELYIQEITGSNRSIENIISILENTIATENNELLTFIKKNPNSEININNNFSSSNNSNKIISNIQLKMEKDFPKINKLSYTIKNLPNQLEDHIGPAFYIVSPIDNINDNTIYINKGSQYLNTPLFTNLAHEAFPGHLYQNCYFNNNNKYPIRNLIKNLGYIEGWASYVTQVAYNYSELDNYYRNLYKYNNSIVLCLSARADIGVHYENWSKKNIKEYFSKNNCPIDDEGINQLYNIIIEEPGDYLPYAIGYIEIHRLLKNAEKKYGDDFNLKKFHTALLDAGPAPFSSIKSHINY